MILGVTPSLMYIKLFRQLVLADARVHFIEAIKNTFPMDHDWCTKN
jgi:hypothetical protein